MEGIRIIDQHREAIAAATEALANLGAALSGAYGSELSELLTEIDALTSAADGARAETLLETTQRGVEGEEGMTLYAWIGKYSPSLLMGGRGQLAKMVHETNQRTRITPGLDYDAEDVVVDAEAPIAIIWDRVRTGAITPALGLVALREMESWSDRLQPAAVGDVTRGVLDVGAVGGASMMRALKTAMLARYGRPDMDEVEVAQEKLRRFAFLSAPNIESAEITRYTMGLTPEQAAVIEAALGPLAKPRPNPETGEADLRTNGQRRAEALLELCSRAAAADAHAQGGPAESDACVHVSVSLEELERRAGAGEVLGSAATGTRLGIETLRRLCCDADLIPHVLGVASESLDEGFVKRLFTRRQRRTLWRRDTECTFPGCSRPAAWTKAHHVLHWADGGPSNLDNAALLCQMHHTYVHSKRLWAVVLSEPDERGRYVVWDLTPGSYDRELEELRRRGALRRPPVPDRTDGQVA
ncbi:MAG: DUF222 domain-containing protein [Intrasporangiaceae bacterium]|nr:DUF222 domain-containing protein [Intrasporangiaceae bacterium]